MQYDQFPRMVRLCALPLLRTLIPAMKRLYILDSGKPSLELLLDIVSSPWQYLFRTFTAVEDLYLSQELATHIARAMHRTDGPVEGMTEVLPSLRNLFLERLLPLGPGEEEEAIKQVIIEQVTPLNLASLPMAVSRRDRVWKIDKCPLVSIHLRLALSTYLLRFILTSVISLLRHQPQYFSLFFSNITVIRLVCMEGSAERIM